MKTASKSPKTAKSTRQNKDGYGAHWHSVGWLAAIAIVLSASSMTLSASAQSTTVTPTTLLRGINDMRVQLNRVESKIDRLDAKVNTLSAPPAPTTNAIVQPIEPTENRDTVTLTEPQEQLSDATKCRLACEDEFNACAKFTTIEEPSGYELCKESYESCFYACGQ
jgi:hypothetical protein